MTDAVSEVAVVGQGAPRQAFERKVDVPGRRGWIAALVAGFVMIAFLWPLLVDNTFLLAMGTLVALGCIGAVSLHLIIRTGHVSFAHAGFMGIGAYVCVLLVMRLQLPFAISLAAGAAAAAALALLIGPIVLRLTGKYFVLVTFMLGEIIRMAFVEGSSLTGGSNGIFGIPAPYPAVSTPRGFYYFALVFALLCIALCARIIASEIGRAMDSVRESEHVARCSGIPILRLKVTIFVIACALAGIDGALLAHFLQYVDPTMFGMIDSLNLVVMNVIGGMNNLIGPIIGAVFLTILPELLRGYVELQRVIFGIILIVVMAALPGGIVELTGLVKRLIAGRAP
ncbi:MAG: branched-chain amino acid ABC transporter permease [Bradyrhizobiaceae bacterium]|nr:branched-chain amino acid ABC transporter permease [Bradyrhizobiaceae bacterium]